MGNASSPRIGARVLRRSVLGQIQGMFVLELVETNRIILTFVYEISLAFACIWTARCRLPLSYLSHHLSSTTAASFNSIPDIAG